MGNLYYTGVNVPFTALEEAFGGPVAMPSAWDVLKLAGQVCPGLLPQGGLRAPRKYEWDKKVGKGTEGGTTTFTGRPPAEGSFKLQMWTDAQIAAWYAMVKVLSYDPIKRQPAAVSIYHPSLWPLKLTQIVIEEIGNIEHVGHGLYEVECKFSEFAPPPAASAVATPKQTKDGNDPTDAAIGQLTALGQQVQTRLQHTTELLNKLTAP